MSETVDKNEIFESLKKILLSYSKYFDEGQVKTDKLQFHLWSKNKVLISTKIKTKPKKIYFAGIIIQKNFVGFYYMPVYSQTNLKKYFESELLSLLKGKSCFHIKKLNPKLKTQIKNALELGFNQYKKRRWV